MSRPDPNWNDLYQVASAQGGLFTTKQAATTGYSPQLLAHHVHAGRIASVRRGIYRLVHFPTAEQEELIEIWLWSEGEGVFSHQTALSLEDLSDALPAQIHMTVPLAWKARRLRVPKKVVLEYAELPRSDRTWIGSVPVTTPMRTLIDCANAHVSPELVAQAIVQARHRGLVAPMDLARIKRMMRVHT
jgi:predicted transcriptional regulator of viral defense system